jgi:uncharacterized membrane protein
MWIIDYFIIFPNSWGFFFFLVFFFLIRSQMSMFACRKVSSRKECKEGAA